MTISIAFSFSYRYSVDWCQSFSSSHFVVFIPFPINTRIEKNKMATSFFSRGGPRFFAVSIKFLFGWWEQLVYYTRGFIWRYASRKQTHWKMYFKLGACCAVLFDIYLFILCTPEFLLLVIYGRRSKKKKKGSTIKKNKKKKN